MPKGEAPKEYVVQSIPQAGKVVIDGQLADVLPKGSVVAEGQTIRGWLNNHTEYGLYIKIAEDRPRNGSGGGSNNEGQIIGWAHTLGAAELAPKYIKLGEAIPHEEVAERAREILAQRNASARPEAPPTSSPADQGSANGADTPAQPSETLTGSGPPF